MCYKYSIHIYMSKKDYYAILGVDKKANSDEIKKAFFKIAAKHHPDKKDGNEAKFKEASEAYGTLSDEKKRREYDMYGQTFAGAGAQHQNKTSGFGGFSGFEGFDMSGFQNVEFDFGDMGDMFGNMWGGGFDTRKEKRGRDISIEIEASFKESIFGTERNVLLSKVSKCKTCNGGGGDIAKGKTTCKACNGVGRLTEAKRTIMGVFQTVRECDHCDGTGQAYKEKCNTCHGQGTATLREEIKVVIPAGMQNGEMIRMSQMGEAVRGGVSGDLYVKVRISTDKSWTRENNDLSIKHDIKLTDAILGAEHLIVALDGEVTITVPPGSNTGDILRVKGRGVPHNMGRNRGDILVKLSVMLPKKLDKEMKKIIESLRDIGL